MKPGQEAAVFRDETLNEQPGGRNPLATRATRALSVGALGSAALATWPPNVTWGAVRAAYVFKPLTMVLLLALASTSSSSLPARYRWSIVAGLLCSMAGDVCLMLPQDRFLPGLACFLAAHLCYLLAFTTDCRVAPYRLPFALSAMVGGVLLIALWPGVPPALRLPVVLYAGVILTMAAQAISRAVADRNPAAVSAGVGAVLFVISDAALAWNRFGHSFHGASAVILSTYFTGQWLIALSVGGTRKDR